MDTAISAHRAVGNSPIEPTPGFKDAVRFWEWRRVAYNALLAVVVILWVALSWPHFRPAMTLQSLLFLLFAALMANLCYCAAYLVDIPMQSSSLGGAWRRWRWTLWLLGTLFAILIANYWIADEIYSYVR